MLLDHSDFCSKRMRSSGDASIACASSNKVRTVGLRPPRSNPLMYCWENPERSATSSCVRFCSRLSRAKLSPTTLRMSIRLLWRRAQAGCINYNMYYESPAMKIAVGRACTNGPHFGTDHDASSARNVLKVGLPRSFKLSRD